MEREAIRLRILEIAADRSPLGHEVITAEDFAEFVFDREPGRIRMPTIAAQPLKTAKLRALKKRK